MWLLASPEDPSRVPTAGGVVVRSLLGALNEFVPVTLVAGGAIPRRSVLYRRARQAYGLLFRGTSLNGTVNQAELAQKIETVRAATFVSGVIFNSLRSAATVLSPHWRSVLPTIYFAHNREAEGIRSLSILAPSHFERAVLRREARQIGKIEDEVCQRVSAVVALTPEDAERFRAITNKPVVCLPPVLEDGSTPYDPGTSARDAASEPCVTFISSFVWAAKRWNAQWVIDEVLPRVWAQEPSCRLVIVGAGANQLKVSDPRIQVNSDVDDVRPFYARADVLLVADQQVSGLKFKTVQGAIAGCAMVSTTAGIEGTGLVRDRDVLVADDTTAFAQSIVSLVRDRATRERLARNASSAIGAVFDRAAIRTRYRVFVDDVLNELSAASGEAPTHGP